MRSNYLCSACTHLLTYKKTYIHTRLHPHTNKITHFYRYVHVTGHIYRLRKVGMHSTLITTYKKKTHWHTLILTLHAYNYKQQTSQHKGITYKNHYSTTVWWQIHFIHMNKSFFSLSIILKLMQQCRAVVQTHPHTLPMHLLLVPWLVSMKCLHLCLLCVCHWFTEWIERHFYGLLPHHSLSLQRESIDSSYGHHALEYKYKDYTGQLIRGRGHRHVGVHESISLWPGFNDIK